MGEMVITSILTLLSFSECHGGVCSSNLAKENGKWNPAQNSSTSWTTHQEFSVGDVGWAKPNIHTRYKKALEHRYSELGYFGPGRSLPVRATAGPWEKPHKGIVQKRTSTGIIKDGHVEERTVYRVRMFSNNKVRTFEPEELSPVKFSSFRPALGNKLAMMVLQFVWYDWEAKQILTGGPIIGCSEVRGVRRYMGNQTV